MRYPDISQLNDEDKRKVEQWLKWKQLKRPNRSWRGVERVRAALKRLSRDRWLSPDEVRKKALALAWYCSGRPHRTVDYALPAECNVIGMLRGEPPAYRLEDDYMDFFKALHGLKRDSGAKAELIILNLTIKRISNGRESNRNIR